MTTLAEHIIVAGAENRPLILEKSMYDSWASQDGQTRPKKYSEFTEAQQLQDDCDVQATNIIPHSLPPDVYALVNHQEAAKDIRDIGETLYEYYWRFSQLINDIHTIGMTMLQVQVNTKFLNALPPEWSKFVTDVKLAKSLYTTNYDQFYAYLSPHERHANEVRLIHEPYSDPLTLAVPTFQQGEDPIDCINKAMAFLSVVASSFPPSNNQLRTSSNPRNQATIQDGRVTCTQPKRPRNSAWFKKKLMLVKAQEASQILDEEQLAFIIDPEIEEAQVAHCDSDVLSEVPYSDTYPNDMINQDVQEMPYSEQPHIIDFLYNEILHVIAKEHDVIFVIDDEETLILEEESRSKMLDKQNDPISIKQKINISPIDYSKLNNIKEDFGKRFVTQKELSAKQAFWLKHSSIFETPVKSHTPIRIEAPSKLPKVSLVNESLKKLKYHLASFDKVVKKKTTSDAITAGAWGFKHRKACFLTEIIPVIKVLKDTFNAFDKNFLDEITKVQNVFNQMEVAVDQCSEIVHIAVNSVDIIDVNKSCLDECNNSTQLNQEIFQKGNFGENQNATTFNQLFEINELKAQSQEKDTIIRKLKDRTKSLTGKESVEKVKNDIDEFETINIELEHSVAKLLSENENLRKEQEHLKSIYKDQFDSIKKTRVRSKEHSESLIAHIKAKFVENSDLNAQHQEKVFAIAALKNELRKLKRKNVVHTADSIPFATTIAR
ncbi:hypothetical protein Tco_0818450 [Tanacetum coccineum]